MKKIAVLIRRAPLNTIMNAEALRVSVGMTLRDDRVSVIFIGDGVWSASAHLDPSKIGRWDSKKEFDVLKMLKCRLIADRTSFESGGAGEPVPGVELVSRSEVIRTLNESDIVIPF